MKNIFEKPEIEILLFDEEDITAENSTVVQEEMTAARAVTAMMGDDMDGTVGSISTVRISQIQVKTESQEN
ncbi:MAG: hypothetical protein ACLRQ0_10005 [Monoglobales bacterium]